MLNLHPELAARIELVFFDGEEAYERFTKTDGLYGSRFFATKARNAKRVQLLRGRNCLGHDRRSRPHDHPPARFAGAPGRRDLRRGDALNAREHFTYLNEDILDDHTPLNEVGIPTIDLIDFDYPPWHTAGDTMDKLSADSLQTVGAVTLYYLAERALPMKRFLLLLLAVGLGLGAAEYLTTLFPVRRWIGDVVGRGELQALVGRRGIYDNDVDRAWRGDLFALGLDSFELEAAVADAQKRAALHRLLAEKRLNAAATNEPTDPAAVARETQLLRDQFRDDKTWRKSLALAGLTPRTLEREVAANLRGRAWLEQQIAGRIQPNDSEVRRYYDEHRAAFQQPLRLRASHLFLAAPDGYPADVIERQGTFIEQLAKRIANGESFPALVAEFSEDEATKMRDGDLGYFAEKRMLPEIFAAAGQLQPGQTSAPVRSRLGFHILRLTETRPARQLSLEEARPQIVALLENQQRAAAVASVLASRNAH